MARSGKGLMARQLLLVTASAAASAPIVPVARTSGDGGRAVVTRRVAAERPQRPCAGPSVAAWAAWTAARPGSRTPAPTAPVQPELARSCSCSSAWHRRHRDLITTRQSPARGACMLRDSLNGKDVSTCASTPQPGLAAESEPAHAGLVTKEIYQDALQCTRLAWFRRHRLLPPDKFSDTELYLMEQGIAFEHDYVSTMYSGGSAIGGMDMQLAAAQTLARMAHAEEQDDLDAVVFQATFLTDAAAQAAGKGGVAKADVLEYAGGGEWDVVEVKSCSEKSVDAYLTDLAFTVYVATRAGVNVRRAVIVAVASQYRFGMACSERFARIDLTDKIFSKMGPLHELAGNGERERAFAGVDHASSSPAPPPPDPVPHCKKCALFRQCVGRGLDHPIWELPRLTGKRFFEVAQYGLEIAGVPDHVDLTKAQQRVKQCVVASEPLVDHAQLGHALQAMPLPHYFLDFESVSPLNPPFADVAPWQTIVTQYSLHVQRERGSALEHRDFLAEAGTDCRESLVRALLHDVGDRGAIVVYSSYEQTQLKALAELLPHLAAPIASVLDRLVDLEKMIKSHVSHPGFRGRSSLKVTLPVLVPEYATRYAALPINNGADAATAFESLASSQLAPEVRARIRKQLLDYCALDTLAMVELHSALQSLVAGGAGGADAGQGPPNATKKRRSVRGAGGKAAGDRGSG